MARVFVGIPTRNRPGYVIEAIKSVLGQKLTDYRVLVSDDASEEGAASTVEKYVKDLDDPRVSYCYHKTCLKEYDHGRFLLGQCREEFFTILHDDDVLGPDFLQTAVDTLSCHTNAAFMTSNQHVINGQGGLDEQLTKLYNEYQGRDRYPEGLITNILEPLFKFGFFPITGTMFRTQALVESSFVDHDCHGNFPFEFNIYLRLGERNMAAYYTPRRLVSYRFHDNTIRATEKLAFNRETLDTMIRIIERRRFSGDLERTRRKTLSFLCRNYAIVALQHGEKSLSREYFSKAVSYNPLSWKIWLYRLVSMPAPGMIPGILRLRNRLKDTSKDGLLSSKKK